jgi:hypothetical protein
VSESRLNVQITATDTARAEIAALQRQIAKLADTVVQADQQARRMAETSAVQVRAVADALRSEMGILQQEISLRREQISVAHQQEAAAKAAEAAAAEGARMTEMALRRALAAAVDLDNALVKAFNRAPTATVAAMDAQIAQFNRKREEVIYPQADRFVGRSMVRQLSGQQFFSAWQRDKLGGGGEAKSAAESAAAFAAALGPAGTGITSAGTKKTIEDLMGLNRQFMSARDSAKVFQSQLGELGTAVRTTPSAGFHKLVSDLVGVKQTTLSAAESFKVFEAAGMTATAGAGGGGIASKLGDLFRRESRHIVGFFDSIARGQRGQALSSVGAAARDAGLGVGALATSMGALVAVMAGGAILRSAEHLGAWAERTRAAASAAGMGIQEFSSLQGAMTLTGVKADSANASIRRLAVNLSTALADPTSKAAEAFHVLGISQEQLTKNGTDTAGALKLLADAYTRTAEGANKSAAMSTIFGRSFETIIPALERGSAGLSALQVKAQALGITLSDESAKSLEETGQAVTTLSEKIQGQGIRAMVAWGPVIKDLVQGIDGLITAVEALLTAVGHVASAIDYVTSIPGKALNWTLGQGFKSNEAVMTAFLKANPDKVEAARKAGVLPSGWDEANKPKTEADTAKIPVPAMPAARDRITALEQMRTSMAESALAAAQGSGTPAEKHTRELQAEIEVMQKVLASHQLSAREELQVRAELANKQISLINQTASVGEKVARQDYANFASAQRLKIAEAEGNISEIVAIYDKWLSAAEGRYKQSASVIASIEKEKTQAINRQKLSDIRSGASLQGELNRAHAIMGQAQVIAGGNYGQPGQASAGVYASQAGQIEAQTQSEVAALTEVMNAAKTGSNVQRQAAQEILSIITRAKQQEIELYKKAAQTTDQSAKAISGFFAHVGAGVETFGDALLKAAIAPKVDLIRAGFTTLRYTERGAEIKAAAQRLVLDIGNELVKGVEHSVSQFTAKGLAALFKLPLDAASGGLSGVLGSGISKLMGLGPQVPQAAQFGLATAQLNMFSAALMRSTAVLTGHAATTATSATANTLNTGATTLNTAATTANSAAETAAGGGNMFGGIFSLFGSIGSLFGFAGGGIVPSAAGGMIVGGMGGTLAKLHEQEMVLPAPLSRGLQEMIGRGGRTNQATLHYSPTIHTSSRSRGGTGLTRAEFSQMMSLHSGAMLGEARNMMRNGWRPA